MSIFTDDKGFSFVELLIAMVISVLVLAAVYKLFSSASEIFVTQERRVDTRQDIRSILYLMTKDIRMAGLDPKRNAACAGIESANATSLHILYDYNGNGTCSELNDCDRDYLYNSNENVIKLEDRGEGGHQLFAEDISSLNFVYTLSDGSNSTSPSDLNMIRMVNIQICRELKGAYAQKHDQLFCYNATVRCRNMGLE